MPLRPRGFSGAGCNLQYDKVKCKILALLYTIKRAAALPGGQGQYAGGYYTVATGACPDTEITRRYIC